MGILIEIGHPAHVHFFRPLIFQLKKDGHRVHIVTRNKEITNRLLDGFGIEFTCLSQPAHSTLGKVLELIYRWFQVGKLIAKNRVRLVMSISGISTSLPARLLGVKNLTFTDTEDAGWTNRIALPNSDGVYTPTYYLRSVGKNHRRYPGLHELVYLQGFDLAYAKKRVQQLGLPEHYAVVRFVANDALHDKGLRGMEVFQVEQLLHRLRGLDRVFIHSQKALPESLHPYRLPTPIEDIHAVLAGATLFVGDSPTMAVESALVGTPSFLVSHRCPQLGNMQALERLGLLQNFRNWDDLLGCESVFSRMQERKARFLAVSEAYRESVPNTAELLLKEVKREVSLCVA